jgi:hypothetical protein
MSMRSSRSHALGVLTTLILCLAIGMQGAAAAPLQLRTQPWAHQALKLCSETVGSGPCRLPPEHEPGCTADPSAPPKMKLDVLHSGGFHGGHMIYGTGFDVSGANKAMRLTGVLVVPFIHYRKVVHVSVVACNRQGVFGNFPNVVITGNLPKPRQVQSYQLLTIRVGSRTVFRRKYAVTLGGTRTSTPPASSVSGSAVAPARPPGVYLEQSPSCPQTNVMLEVHYECTIAIVNGGTAYRHVTLGYDIPSAGLDKEVAMPMLAANGEVRETIPVVYGKYAVGDGELSTNAIILAVEHGTGFMKPLLFRQAYGVSLAANCVPVTNFGVTQVECG